MVGSLRLRGLAFCQQGLIMFTLSRAREFRDGRGSSRSVAEKSNWGGAGRNKVRAFLHSTAVHFCKRWNKGTS